MAGFVSFFLLLTFPRETGRSPWAQAHLFAEPLRFVVQVTSVLFWALTHAPESKHDDATNATAHVEMEVGLRHGLQL